MSEELSLTDPRATLGVLGGLLQDSNRIDNPDYPLSKYDFENEFHRIIFVAIHNSYEAGATSIDEFVIDSYLSSHQHQYEIFQENNGLQYIRDARAIIDNEGSFDFFFHKLKKLSLLRYYESKGLDTSAVFNRKVTDPLLKEEEIKKLEETSELRIIESIEDAFVITPKMKFTSNILTDEHKAGDGLIDLIEKYRQVPDYGYPMASIGLTTLSRAARKGCLYLRSAGTGTGKTRMGIMDACNFAIPWKYDLQQKKFVYTGMNVPTLFIEVENSVEELQRIVLATVSGVPTSHIAKGNYTEGEYERVKIAAKYIEESPLYLVYCDDYSITDIENLVKKYVLTKDIEICIFDYLQSSLRLMNEIRSKGAAGMQEYQMLRVFATRLKALAERLNICIISATQLNGEANSMKYKDQTCLEGSKSIANKIDLGVICTKPSLAEQAKLEKITTHQMGCPEINLLQWCYKIRDGEYSKIIICSHIDLGIMTIKDCFMTDYDFHLIDVELDDIQLVEEVIEENSIPADEVLDQEEEPKPRRPFDW